MRLGRVGLALTLLFSAAGQRHELSLTEFYAAQKKYLTWLDARFKRGDPIGSYAGFGDIRSERVRGNDSLVALVGGIHTGSYCNYDETAVVYNRSDRSRIAVFNAERTYKHGHHLESLAAGGGGLFASAWVASSCASNWNGSIFRIDRAGTGATENLLLRNVLAYDPNPVKIHVTENSVSFEYTASSRVEDILTRDAVAVYQIRGRQAIRQSPLAPSYGSFIQEWLELDDAEAARWSSPQAARAHHPAAAMKGSFTWTHVAACPDREIELNWGDTDKTVVFRISGTRAVDLRMESVSDHRAPSCREMDISKDISHINNEP